MALTAEDVRTALKDCYDPEIPVNIVDLGLIYRIDVLPDLDAPGQLEKSRVEVDVSMTSQGCPSHAFILDQVRNRLAGIAGISQTEVTLVWEPAWSPERLSPEARKSLGID